MDPYLEMAIDDSDLAEVKASIAAGADVNAKDKKTGNTPLHTAVGMANWGNASQIDTNLKIIKVILAAGADVNAENKRKKTPLHFAASSGLVAVVQELLAAGANINALDMTNDTPLHQAISTNNLAIVQALLATGANTNTRNTRGTSPLDTAILQNSLEILQALLAAGADVNSKDSVGNTALHKAVINTNNAAIIQALKAAGANVNIVNNGGDTPLDFAISESKVELVLALLLAGANVNHSGSFGFTPLHIACTIDSLAILEMLLVADADINAITDDGESPLFLAATNANLDIVKKLFEFGGIDKEYRKDGKTIIEWAEQADFSTPEIREFILQTLKPMALWKGWTRADVDQFDILFGESAKDYACCPVCLKFVERSEACMYMKHNCVALGGYYHRELYDKYKNDQGFIGWCTICGRIALGHRHYKLGYAQGDVPSLAPSGSPFELDCSVSNGGGGPSEKIARIRRLREYALELQEEVGTKTEAEALNELTEETWNAPMVRNKKIAKIMANKEWNIKSNVFPAPVVNNNGNNTNANVPNVTRPGTNSVDLAPVVEAAGMNFMGEEGELIHFRHRNPDGSINEHTNNWITRDSLEGFLTNAVKNFGDENFGYCYLYPGHCKSPLYPEEVKPFIPEELYEEYRKKFNKKNPQVALVGGRRKTRKLRRLRTQRGGTLNVFVEATNAECIPPWKPTGGNHRTTRKRRLQRRRTYRR